MAANRTERPKGDHYHTGEILLRLARDRGRSRLLFAGSVVAVAAIIAFFALQKQRPSTSPPSAIPGAPAGTPVATKVDAAPSRNSVLTPLSPPAPPPQPATVPVQVVAIKPGMFWLDAKPLGVKKQFNLQLTPGMHELRGKFGRKLITEKVLVGPHAPLSVRFDPRKKKALIKPATP